MRTLLFLTLVLSIACDDGDTAPVADAESGPEAGGAMDGQLASDAALDAMTTYDQGTDAAVDLTEALFDPTRLLEIRVDMAEADWDALRIQRRDFIDFLGPGCLDGPPVSPFTWFEAIVTLDGVPIPEVAVRKKGFFGSVDEHRPSLKLHFEKYVDGRRVEAAKRMTLNNNRQDPAIVRQCLGYGYLREVGLPAPRCNFARVYVNGRDLGVYSHVESIKKPFVRRHFADDGGNLYEGALSDFFPEMLPTFERKTNEDDPSRADLEAVVAALEAPDEALEARLAEVIDLDSFFEFWAAEVVIGHWDGYAGNVNNFYLYADPDNGGRLAFIPWGIDGIMHLPQDRPAHRALPQSVFAKGRLAWRLYDSEPTRARYHDELRRQLDSIWNDEHRQAELERMIALVRPELEGETLAVFDQAIEPLRLFVTTRRLDLHQELALGPPVWPEEATARSCWEDAGELDASFEATWGTYPTDDIFGQGELSASGVYDDEGFELQGGAVAGEEEGAVLILAVAPMSGGRAALIHLRINPALVFPGADIPVDWSAAEGLFAIFEDGAEEPSSLGLLFGAALELDNAALMDGAPIHGRLRGPILRE